jgi:hypothetical protein
VPGIHRLFVDGDVFYVIGRTRERIGGFLFD